MLKHRILSAIVGAPPVLLLLWLGPPYSLFLIVLGSVILAWEWTDITVGRRPVSFLVLLFAIWGAVAVRALDLDAATSFVMAGWLIFAGILCTALGWRHVPHTRRTLLLIGPVYLGFSIGILALVFEEFPPFTVLSLVVLVWVVDIAAYAFGRLIGGPKLWPAVSPNKTWAGLIGAAASLAVILVLLDPEYFNAIGLLNLIMAGVPGPLLAVLEHPLLDIAIGVGIAVSAQAGDLFESWVKRRAGVKDSGRIMPGHGGLLDRVDGLLGLFVFGPFALFLLILVILGYYLASQGLH